MSTTTKNRPKIDFEQWTKPKDPEPKTLEECLAEAGGFPFVARAVSPTRMSEIPLPIGTEAQFTGRVVGHIYHGRMLAPELDQNGMQMCVDPNIRRWVLVGHKT